MKAVQPDRECKIPIDPTVFSGGIWESLSTSAKCCLTITPVEGKTGKLYDLEILPLDDTWTRTKHLVRENCVGAWFDVHGVSVVGLNWRSACTPKQRVQRQKTYFIQGGDAIKIGVSDNVIYRLREIQRHSPIALKILAIINKNVERRLHSKFKHLWRHGEWFTALPELLDYIREHATPWEDKQ